ncbi:glycoside hydrolase family 13 protein [Phlebiopsis gigantea 11061_1 CR5-6]|uniref:alpha-amylase n=1 Tax=Phlebiopsis gigantea (strain 11061_1 CR5-6) TaxID=745531 RepID=A0A0C3S3Y6_PHLG1|nr:glycoside hydrolase family 13 protein [Phlebiopsis gigantea 11061_1 CR5-6]
MFSLIYLSLYLSALGTAFAATADEWRGRSIYQIIVDRFALPAGSDTTKCNPGDQTWCGGTWNTVRENLDYIQNAGFTAIWISPVSQNYDGPRSAYGDAYHGYWIADASRLNDRFGTADDLKALSDEVHRRGMYLMVDVVVNNVMSTSLTPDLSTYMFKEQSQYHTYCPVDYSNITSEQNCWLGDTKVPLPDLNTQDPTVISGYSTWIQSLVKTYNIDGLRIDAAKHVDPAFWPQFCGAAGVYCIGEVFGDDIDFASTWQGPLDAILQYPMYNALVEAFAIPGPQNMSAMTDVIAQSKQKFKDPSVLGNFLENQDLPRWHNFSVDIQSLWNPMVFNFMSDGIPIVYYGQEQGFAGNADPWNREPLWTSNYTNTSTYQLITKLNAFRNFLVNNTDNWLNSSMEVLSTTQSGLAIMKGPVISIMTNIGSPPANITVPVYTPYAGNLATIDILTCSQFVVGSNGTVDVQYNKGGVPTILVPTSVLENSGFCGNSEVVVQDTKGQLASSALSHLTTPASSFAFFLLLVFGLVNSGIGL